RAPGAAAATAQRIQLAPQLHHVRMAGVVGLALAAVFFLQLGDAALVGPDLARLAQLRLQEDAVLLQRADLLLDGADLLLGAFARSGVQAGGIRQDRVVGL